MTQATEAGTPAERQVRWWWTAGVLACITAVTFAIYWSLTASQSHTIRGENDLPGTLNEAEWMRLWPPRLSSPHFLLPAAIRTLDWLVSPRVAICLVLAAAAGVLYWSYAKWFGSRLRVIAPLAAATVFLIESPSYLVLSGPFSDIHHWASPTDLLGLATLVPLLHAVVEASRTESTVVFADSVFRLETMVTGKTTEWEPPQPRDLKIGGLAIIATLAKPSLMISAWFAIPMWMLLRSGRSPIDRNRRHLVEPFAVGAAALIALAWQTWFLSSGQAPFDAATGWTVDPFWVFDEPTMRNPLVHLIFLIPLVSRWVTPTWHRNNPYVALTSWLWVWSLVPTLFLRETEAQRMDGNFTVGSRLAMFLWVAASTMAIAEQIDRRWIHPERLAPLPPDQQATLDAAVADLRAAFPTKPRRGPTVPWLTQNPRLAIITAVIVYAVALVAGIAQIVQAIAQ